MATAELPIAQLAATATKLLVTRENWWDEDEDNRNCQSAVPGHNGNVPVDACNSYYNYDPEFAPAVAVAAIFGVFLGVHLFMGIVYKKKYTWVLIMGAAWETIGFALHALGAKDQQQIAYATTWQILFLLAPLWINAFVYMTLARMVIYWLPEGTKVSGMRAALIAKLFVWADVICFIIQGVGGSMASPGAEEKIIKIGLNIYLTGMGLQQAFICGFLVLMVSFQKKCARGEAEFGKPAWKPLLFALYATLAMITVRIIFRIAEFAGGVKPSNPIPFNEAYTYALDCFPMMVALLILAVWHPGRFLLGPDSEFDKGPSRSERKASKAASKEERRSKKERRNSSYLME